MLTADAIATQQKWEYCVLTRKSETYIVGEFNTLGQEGWELVQVLYHPDAKGIMSWTGFLKRPSTGEAKSAGPAAAATVQPSRPSQPGAPSPGAESAGLGDDDFEFKLQD